MIPGYTSFSVSGATPEQPEVSLSGDGRIVVRISTTTAIFLAPDVAAQLSVDLSLVLSKIEVSA